MRTSDRIPPEQWPDCIGFSEWYFPSEQQPEQQAREERPQAGNEFWPELDPGIYPFFPFQLERPQ